ncbi:MAG: TetR family transcriptional regulator [Oculatellaceae cyanobacterium bins.114]|nr:TetR family transcriptional regulator [Oculatellaceae cyanobacterium bins.114]
MSESPSTAGGMRRKPRQARSQERVNRILDVAEDLFASQGYAATTTNAIATRAEVPIGSLYQFFPDKSAILQALALRYAEKLHQELAVVDEAELAALSLSDYVNQLIDTTDRFFSENPTYHAIFMEVQGTIRELTEIDEATDAQLIQDLATSLARRDASLEPADYEAIAFVLVKATGTLLWLSLSQEKTFRQRLVEETKRFTLKYLQSYFPSHSMLDNNSNAADG